MAHINVPQGVPGIRALFAARPETAGPLCQLAETLLRSPGSLPSGERELIATYVSSLNDCHFCQSSHGAAAAAHAGGDESLVAHVKRDYRSAPISSKLKTLLAIAAQVQRGGKQVTADAIAAAKREGATDVELHDTVLIAAAFCMFNRYVDGLGTWAPEDPAAYREIGQVLAREGYLRAR